MRHNLYFQLGKRLKFRLNFHEYFSFLSKAYLTLIFSVLFSVIWGVAFLNLENSIGSTFGWTGEILFAHIIRKQRFSYLLLYCGAASGFFSGFFWFYDAIKLFKKVGNLITAASIGSYAA